MKVFRLKTKDGREIYINQAHVQSISEPEHPLNKGVVIVLAGRNPVTYAITLTEILEQIEP